MATVVKDFDAERLERLRGSTAPQFRLGGEMFTMRKFVRPDVIVEVEELRNDAPAREALDVIDRAILAFVDPKAKGHERYAQVRAREDDPVTLEDLGMVLRWLAETYTTRPTVQSSPSRNGRRRTGTTSTAGSRSKAATSKR